LQVLVLSGNPAPDQDSGAAQRSIRIDTSYIMRA